jgi:O-methyltransferase
MSDGHLPRSESAGKYAAPTEAGSGSGQTRSALSSVLKIASRIRSRHEDSAQATPPAPVAEAAPYPLVEWEQHIIEEALPHTMTSPARLVATMDAVAYASRSEVPGALVECGVWRGGSVLAMIRTLQHHGISDRDVYLFDTFEGMTRPSEQDTSIFDAPALETWKVSEKAGDIPWRWAFDPQVFDFDSLRSLMAATDYPPDRIHFVKGRVEDTLPGEAPASIAVLRLDTDWYESTWHELVHLYPKVVRSGVLIIDDYGHWDGCRKAVDRYFQECAEPIFLARTDYTGRIGIKAE